MKYNKLLLMTIIPMFCFGIWDADTHDVNNWILSITNHGEFGDLENFWRPESIPFTGAGLWFGSISSQSETLVTVAYGPHGGECEFVPGLKDQDYNSQIARVYMFPTYWPPDPDTYPMAPQNPLTLQESWSCYNDFDFSFHVPGDGKPIGIEVYQTTFADTFSIINDVTFLRYEIKNCTTYTINDAIVSIMWDVDCPGADGYWNGFILGKWFYSNPDDSFFIEDLAYFYGDTFCIVDTFAIGILFIKTPDDLGCTAYKMRPLGWWSPILEEPNEDNERYLTMAGYDHETGVYNPYDSIDGYVDGDDRRVYMSSGKFTLEPGEVKELIIALIAAPYTNEDTLNLAIAARNAKDFYFDSLMAIYENEQLSNPNFPIVNLRVYPNPFSKMTDIRYQPAPPGGARPGITDNRWGIEDISLKIYDATGRVVRNFSVPSTYSLMPSVVSWYGDDDAGHPVPPGIYFCHLKTNKALITQKIVKLQ